MAAGLWIVVGGGLLAVVDVGLRWLGLAARRICGGWWRISPDLWWLVEDLAGSVFRDIRLYSLFGGDAKGLASRF